MNFLSRKHRKASSQPAPAAHAPIAQPLYPVWAGPPPYSQLAPQHTPNNTPYQPQWPTSTANAAVMSQPILPLANIQTDDLSDIIGDQFSQIISSIDEETLVASDNDDSYSIIVTENASDSWAGTPQEYQHTRALSIPQVQGTRRLQMRSQPQKIIIMSKVSFYSNSRLPPDLPTLRVYIPTWPLICLAAQYSANAYRSPRSSREAEHFVSADPRLGTKAMVMKSVPCDDRKTLVFAIRGTSILSLRDWNVNLNTEPVSPAGFIDDDGNYCHAGFLRVAKAMVRPIAARLRTLLEENPSRASCSLLITGHSAGGAVAALLYAHMLSTTVESELNILTGCFKRVHCVTFGAPPMSLLPLTKPANSERRHKSSLFFAFMNEGDPVVRAEISYMRSLVDLLASPLPGTSQRPIYHSTQKPNKPMNLLGASVSQLNLSTANLNLTLPSKSSLANLRQRYTSNLTNKPTPGRVAPSRSQSSRVWRLPQATLSNAGRLVVLRIPSPPHNSRRPPKSARQWELENVRNVSAHTITDEQLRGVVFGDPSMHAMEVYSRRVEMLALKAVTARG